MEYTENVLKKRKYRVSLKFDSKSKEGDVPVYKIKFKIILTPTSDIKFDKKETILGWSFEENPEKVIKFIKKGKQKCQWEDSTSYLTMKKSDFDKLATDQLKILISEEGGVKVRIS